MGAVNWRDELRSDQDKIREYAARRSEPIIAIFDIGTRAARLLVAPKKVPDAWRRSTFVNSGFPFNVGADVDVESSTLTLNSASVDNLCHFLSSNRECLEECGVKDMRAVGTAIFRWLEPDSHRRAVLQRIQLSTGIPIEILTKEEEARLTFLATIETIHRLGAADHLRDEDIILVMDQGGGSLEISWMRWGDRHLRNPQVQKKQSEELGAIALRRRFFTTDADGEYVKPEGNKVIVSTQLDALAKATRTTIKHFMGLPRPDNNGPRVFAFGVGTAVTKMWPRDSNWAIHGRRIGVEMWDQAIAEREQFIEAERRQVRSLWSALNGIEGSGTERFANRPNLDRDLVFLLGAPVFRELLSRSGLNSLTANGFGLRYGVYLDKYWRNVQPSVKSTEDGPYVFVSYDHADKAIVYDEIALLSKLGYRVWYDQFTPAGADIRKTVVKKIQQSHMHLIMMTPDAAKSEWVDEEWICAKRNDKPILQVRLRQTYLPDEWDMRLSGKLYIDRLLETDELYEEKIARAFPQECRRLQADRY